MRRTHYLTITCGLLLGSTVLWAGCGTAQSDCSDGLGACADLIKGGGGSSSSSTMTTASGTMTSSSTGMDPDCLGEIKEGMTEADIERLISDKCGVFVQADTTSAPGNGTKASPFASLQKAIAEASGRNVYVCTSAPFVEAITIAAPVLVYGGFDCTAGWTYSKSTRSNIEAPTDGIAVTILGKGVYLSNLGITANKAKAAGASAIAVLARGAEADLEGCVLEAGDGVPGSDGMDGGPTSTKVGTKGEDGVNACTSLVNNLGGIGPALMCGSNASTGGDGGSGKPGAGSNGSAGSPGTAGKAGIGDVDCGAAEPNGSGDGGVSGMDGTAGAPGAGKGMLDGATGYVGANGGPGGAGTPGQGGGGGGGAKGGLVCSGVSGAGASGGSGGSGGCGGLAGQGGRAGGSSIAIASVDSVVKLTDCSLKSGKGGNGGMGGDLQGGASGGDPGKGGTGIGGSKDACAGGKGGQGGNGGPGGGGQGGHSLTIAYVGMPVTKIGTVEQLPGASGNGGSGGSGNVKGNAGDKGVSMKELLFP